MKILIKGNPKIQAFNSYGGNHLQTTPIVAPISLIKFLSQSLNRTMATLSKGPGGIGEPHDFKLFGKEILPYQVGNLITKYFI